MFIVKFKQRAVTVPLLGILSVLNENTFDTQVNIHCTRWDRLKIKWKVPRLIQLEEKLHSEQTKKLWQVKFKLHRPHLLVSRSNSSLTPGVRCDFTAGKAWLLPQLWNTEKEYCPITFLLNFSNLCKVIIILKKNV